MTTERHKRYMARKRAERIAKGEASARTFINEVREPGPRSLIIAIVDQAMRDYWLFYRAGAIKNGKQGKWPRWKNGRQATFYNMYQDDLKYLLEFFESNCSRLLALADIDIKPSKIKKALHNLEQSGDWQCYYGQGKAAFGINGKATNDNKR